MKIAVVLAGAVAKGAFEAGALQALASTDHEIVRIVATSSGALNGTLLASRVRTGEVARGADLLAELWRDHAGWTDVFHASLRDLAARRAISDRTRVLQLLRDRIPPIAQGASPIELRLLVASLNGITGTVGEHDATTSESVRDFTSADFATAEALERVFTAATASAAFPFLFAPVDVDELGPCVDGGAVNNTPIKWALDGELGAALDAIVVIATTPEVAAPVPALHGLAYAGHLAAMLVGERLYRDLREAEQVNAGLANLAALDMPAALRAQVLAAVGWSGRRHIEIIQIRPTAELPGSSFAGFFDPALRRAYVAAGLARGCDVLGRRS